MFLNLNDAATLKSFRSRRGLLHRLLPLMVVCFEAYSSISFSFVIRLPLLSFRRHMVYFVADCCDDIIDGFEIIHQQHVVRKCYIK